jgi:ABC-type nitrate/sulfonate/bicarbonate transport system permease component
MADLSERRTAAVNSLAQHLRIVMRAGAPWLSFAALLIGWEVAARSGTVTPFMLPSLELVAARIIDDGRSGELFTNLGLTLYRALVGFLIAASLGIALGMLISRNRAIRWFFDPLISVGFPMPKIAFLPIIVLWLGFYDVSKIAMVVFDAIFPVVTATIAGVAGIEREVVWSGRNLGASERRLLWDVMLPAALPQIFSGLQVALPIALIVEIVAEMVMGGYGVGGAMATGSRFANSPSVFAGLLEIAAVGYAMVRGMAALRRRLLIWHPEAVGPPTA